MLSAVNGQGWCRTCTDRRAVDGTGHTVFDNDYLVPGTRNASDDALPPASVTMRGVMCNKPSFKFGMIRAGRAEILRCICQLFHSSVLRISIWKSVWSFLKSTTKRFKGARFCCWGKAGIYGRFEKNPADIFAKMHQEKCGNKMEPLWSCRRKRRESRVEKNRRKSDDLGCEIRGMCPSS